MGLTAALEAQERTMEPATTRQRRACLLALVTVYPPRAGDEETNTARFNLYHDALREYPADVLWDACVECVKTLKFFPAPAEIRAEAEKIIAERRFTISRLRAFKDYAVEYDQPEAEPVEADRERRRADAAAWRKSLATQGVSEVERKEEMIAAAVIAVTAEPEVSDLATAILRARLAASQARNLDLAYLKEIALADARAAWPWLKARGWTALAPEAVPHDA